MTPPDIAGLCERLRAVKSSRGPSDWSGIRQVTTNWHRNPDGPEAADTLERQAAEIERLREALDLASRRFYVFRDMTDHTSDRVCLATWADEARATLTGETNAN